MAEDYNLNLEGPRIGSRPLRRGRNLSDEDEDAGGLDGPEDLEEEEDPDADEETEEGSEESS